MLDCPNQGYTAMPFVAATEQRKGRWQAALDGLVFMFSLMLLPGLWHKCDCPVEKQPTVKNLVFLDLGIARNRRQGKQIML